MKTTPSLPKNNSLQIDFVDLDFMKKIVHSLAQNLLRFDEPIPNFHTRFPNRLESCLAVIEQPEYFGNDSCLQLANLIYRLVKNHPFQNGNKRIAMTTLLVVFHINFSSENIKEFFLARIIKEGKVQKPLANFFEMIAGSKPDKKENYVEMIYKVISETTIHYLS